MEKIFKGYMVLNWRSGRMKIYKKKPKNISPYEIPIEINLKVKMPEKKNLKIEGDVEMSEAKALEILFEQI